MSHRGKNVHCLMGMAYGLLLLSYLGLVCVYIFILNIVKSFCSFKVK